MNGEQVSRGDSGWCGSFPYLVLGEHFVHFLPSHVSNAPQPSQISIAALILTIISGRDRCTHFISRSPRPASLFLSLSLSLSLAICTVMFYHCVTQHTHTHTFTQGSWCDECLVNYTVFLSCTHTCLRGILGASHFHRSLPSQSFTHIHTHTHRQTTPVTHSSKMTAQSGRKRRCVRPAPCIPIKMSELCVILSCTRKGTSLRDRQGITRQSSLLHHLKHFVYSSTALSHP